MTDEAIKRAVDKIWRVRTSGNKDAKTRATELEVELYRSVLLDCFEADAEELKRQLILASDAKPTARSW